MGYIPVHQLAKELGLRPNEVMQMGRDVGVTVVRVASMLSPTQVAKIRELARTLDQRQSRSQTVPSPPARNSSRVAFDGPARFATSLSEPEHGPDYSCTCCGLRMQRSATTSDLDVVPRCGACEHHVETPGEPESRTVARLQDHEGRLRYAYRMFWSMAQENREKMKAAFHSRDSWRGALIEVMLAHEAAGATGCRFCGSKSFPCPTWANLDRVNRGIAREVEKFGSLSDEELHRELYGDDRWDHGAA